MTHTDRNCLVCGTSICGRHHNARTCSEECSHVRQLQKLKDWLQQQPPSYFELQRSKCRERFASRRKVRNCSVCNGPIPLSIHGNIQVCSTECRKARQRHWWNDVTKKHEDRLKLKRQRHREKHRDRLIRQDRERYYKNHEANLQKNREYYSRNKVRLNEEVRRLRKEQPDRFKEYNRRRYERHAQTINERNRQRYADNPIKFRQQSWSRYIEMAAARELIRELGLNPIKGATDETQRTQ